ncbi:hypothetical protein ACTXT7_002602 [Hymenolepis weldensis]
MIGAQPSSTGQRKKRGSKNHYTEADQFAYTLDHKIVEKTTTSFHRISDEFRGLKHIDYYKSELA